MSYIFNWTLPLQLAASGHFDRKATHSRLGPAKVPQTGVDLINMAAPA